MAGIFPDSSSVRPWIQADVFIFSEGVPEIHIQALGAPAPISPLCSQRAPLITSPGGSHLVAQVGLQSRQTPWSW